MIDVQLTYKIGFIGYRNHAKKLLDIFEQQQNFEISYIYHPTKSLTHSHHTNKLDDLYKCDIVVIASPNTTHFNYIKQIIENSNCKIFCEKPPGMNLSEVFAMKEAMITSGCKLMFGFNLRHHQSIIKAKEEVDTGKFGEILWMRGRYGKSVPENFYQDWRSKKKLAGGGIFLDQGIHMLDLFNYFLGAFTSVKSFLSDGH